jgi:hypothetical protein
MSALSLPYAAGTAYFPTPDIPIATTAVAGTPIEISLHLSRPNPGLIVYDLCIRTEWDKVAIAAVLAAVAVVILTLPIPKPILIPVPV